MKEPLADPAESDERSEGLMLGAPAHDASEDDLGRGTSSGERVSIDALRQDIEALEVLLAATGVGILVLDSSLNIRKFTPSMADSFGLLPSDTGRPIGDFTGAIGVSGLEVDLEAVLRSGNAVERRIQDRRGRRFLLRILPRGLARPSRGVVLTLVDRQEGPATEAAPNDNLRQRNQFLRQLSRGLARLEQRERKRLARVLHDDLQQVIAAAKIRIDLAEGHVSDPVGRAHLATAGESLEEAVRASRLLAIELSPPVLDSAPLPKAIGWLVRWIRENHQLDVTLVEESIPPLSEDTKRSLFHAVRELLSNVVKHAEASAVTVRVLHEADGWLRLCVEDDGRGFAPADAAGKTASPAGATLETGLGLLYLQEEIEGLGGRMEIETGPSRGTRVRLMIPVEEDEPGHAAAPHPGAEPDSEEAGERFAGSGKTVRVLVVDDHRIVREGIAAMLNSQEGIEVVAEARDGQEAVALAASVAPDVVLLDVDLPDISGIEVTRLIKTRLPEVEVIGLSIHEEDEVASSMRAAGAADFLTKGCRPGLLYRRIRAVVRA